MKILNRFYPHALALIGFILISLIYFYPVLQGKALFQSDIAQYTGMAKEQNDFREKENSEPYWTNSAFGGMPTYQLGANYPHNYIKKLDGIIRFLPRPADYLFLYFISFYALLLVLKTDPLKAFFGALAFGFSTYLIIIFGAGHNAKAHALGYMPLVVAGVILVFRRRFVFGGLLTAFAAALEINANHFQMTYYLMFLLAAIAIYFACIFIKEKDYKTLFYSAGVFIIAGILTFGTNATGLLATAEYADFSMRGKSELTFNPDGSKNTTTSSMDYGYITEYSYGIAESLNLIAPRLFGGSNSEPLGKDSNVVQFLQTQQVGEGQYISQEQAVEYAAAGMPTYWGDQPGVEAPAYIGAIVFFLAVFALFNDKRKIKYAFLAGAIITLMLSWGKNFSILTNFFIDYVPMYDKFRAVSSIQVIVELCLPVLAIMGLQSFFKTDNAEKWKSLWMSAAVSLGILAVLFVFKGFFEYSSLNDDSMIKSMGPEFVQALKADRKSMFTADVIRSFVLIAITFGLLWLNLKNKLSQTLTVVLVGVFMVGDLLVVDKSYLDSKNFVSAVEMRQPFQPTDADKEILQDTSVYRVYDIQGRLQAKTSYFHKSVGGYSAVRPRRYDQIFDYQVNKNLSELGKIINPQTLELTKSIPVLNALNVKYLMVSTENGSIPITNPFHSGNAWFVSDVKRVNSADEEMKALDKTDMKKTAIVNNLDFGPHSKIEPQVFKTDSLSQIQLITYKPNYIKYQSTNANDGLAVFSEVYYPKGWKIFIDGKESSHFRVDYVLRAAKIPAGKHTIEFKFEPEVVKTGSMISLITSIVMLILLIGGIWFETRKTKEDN